MGGALPYTVIMPIVGAELSSTLKEFSANICMNDNINDYCHSSGNSANPWLRLDLEEMGALQCSRPLPRVVRKEGPCTNRRGADKESVRGHPDGGNLTPDGCACAALIRHRRHKPESRLTMVCLLIRWRTERRLGTETNRQ